MLMTANWGNVVSQKNIPDSGNYSLLLPTVIQDNTLANGCSVVMSLTDFYVQIPCGTEIDVDGQIWVVCDPNPGFLFGGNQFVVKMFENGDNTLNGAGYPAGVAFGVGYTCSIPLRGKRVAPQTASGFCTYRWGISLVAPSGATDPAAILWEKNTPYIDANPAHSDIELSIITLPPDS